MKPAIARARTRGRYPWLDISRGVALLAMASYHLLWDLQSFGYLEPGAAVTGLPKLYARSIATSFLFLVGVSLVLAQSPTIRWRAFLIRLGKIGLAAALVTVATYYTSPRSFIYFGILHSIAVASLVGLVFLRVPALITLLSAGAAIIAPLYLKSELFNQPWLWWTGLATSNRLSDDFVPLLPWIGPVLLGIGSTRLALQFAWLGQRSVTTPIQSKFTGIFTFLGKHGLVFYLVHQPVLIAAVYAMSMIAPAPAVEPVEAYQRDCMVGCRPTRTERFCTRFCSCTVDRLMEQNLFNDVMSQKISVNSDSRIDRISAQCTHDALQ